MCFDKYRRNSRRDCTETFKLTQTKRHIPNFKSKRNKRNKRNKSNRTPKRGIAGEMGSKPNGTYLSFFG